MTMVKKKHKSESFEAMLRRFKRKCEKVNTSYEVKRREFYEKPSAKRKLAKEMAVKKEQKRQQEQDIKRW